MELRELRGDDLFEILPIIGKLDVKDDLIAAFEGQIAGDEQDVEKVGVKVMANLVQKAAINLPLIRDDLNKLLADLSGTKVKEIQELSLVEYTKLVFALFKKPEIKEVFTSLGSLQSETTDTE